MRISLALCALMLAVGCRSKPTRPTLPGPSQPSPAPAESEARAPVDSDDPDAILGEMERLAREYKEDAAHRERESQILARRRTEESMKHKEEERQKKEAERKSLEGLGVRESQAEEQPLFEERWADVILKVRAELQKVKRW
ncbi:MAG: hypothetical protein HYY16_04020 [Planctomycetes bacterium]|nr:hypothetical protein [Planctomycetota bacterium]